MPSPIQIPSLDWVTSRIGTYYVEGFTTDAQVTVLARFSIPNLANTKVTAEVVSLANDLSSHGAFEESAAFFRNGNLTELVGNMGSVASTVGDGTLITLATDGINILLSVKGLVGKTIIWKAVVHLTPQVTNIVIPLPTNLPDPITDDVISYWNCNEASGNLVDSKGGNTLVISSGAPGSVAGKIATARSFNRAIPDYFSIPDFAHTNLRFGPKTRTVIFWLNVTSLIPGRIQVLITKPLEVIIYINDTSGKIIFNLLKADASLAASITSSIVLIPGSWYFVVCKYNLSNTSVSIQINDGGIDTSAQTDIPNDGSVTQNDFMIASSGGFNSYTGALDEIGIFDGNIPADQLSYIYSTPASYPYR